MNTQSFSFDVSKQPLATPVLYLGQGDKNGTTIEAAIYDNGAPLALTNYSVRFSMRLPDDVSYYSVNGTVSGNVATIPINEEYAAVFVGQTSVAYIEVFSGTTLICSTNRIDVVVLPSAEANADPSTAYSDEITEATNRANAAAAAAEGVILQSMPTMSTTIKGGAICGDGLKMSGDSVGVDAATNTRIDAITADNNPQGNEAITITGLNRFWANIKQAFAAIVHGHAISDVDGLQAALDGKAASSHTHTESEITDLGDYLPLSGGTLSGALYIEVPSNATNNNGNELEFRNQRSIVDTRIGSTPSSNQYWGTSNVRDANGDSVWYNQQALQTGGRLYRSYVVQRKSADGATTYNNGFYIGLEADGTPYISFTPDRTAANPGRSAWVEGLGLDIYGQYTSLSSSPTLTTSAQKLPLKTFKGKNCSATTDNGIKVAQAGTYMVWGSAYVHSGYTEGDLVHVCIYKNSTSVLDDNDRASNANPYQTRFIGPIFLDLAANDVVYLYAYNQTAARGTIASRDNMGLFVKRVW